MVTIQTVFLVENVLDFAPGRSQLFLSRHYFKDKFTNEIASKFVNFYKAFSTEF